MASEALTLYGDDTWTSPYVLSCFVGLTEEMLPFEVKTLDLPRAEHKQD